MNKRRFTQTLNDLATNAKHNLHYVKNELINLNLKKMCCNPSQMTEKDTNTKSSMCRTVKIKKRRKRKTSKQEKHQQK